MTRRRYRVEFYTDAAGERRFRVVASNGRTVGTSEGYTAAASAKAGAELIVAGSRTLRKQVFRSENDRLWYWRLKGRNGEVVLSSEGYLSKHHANKTADRILSAHAELFVFAWV